MSGLVGTKQKSYHHLMKMCSTGKILFDRVMTFLQNQTIQRIRPKNRIFFFLRAAL
jgi:hypothetical protein